MAYQLKSISKAGIAEAIAKVELYRYINEPEEAESICRDILAIEPEQQLARRMLGLAITDQFIGAAADRYPEVLSIFQSLRDPYERLYYTGLLYERRAKAQLLVGYAAHILLPLIEETFKSAPRAHWLERLAKYDIPVAPVQTVAEFMEHPAVRHHDLVHEYEHPEVGRLRMMGQPLVFDDTPTRDPGPPPTLGQHTGEILTELGYSDAAIADLRRRHVLGGPA